MSKRLLAIVSMGFLLAGCSIAAAQQNPPAQPRQPRLPEFAGERAFGTIASVGVDRFAIKKPDGTEQTIMVDDKTRYHQGQQEIQLEDLRTGDRVVVRTRQNADNQLVAQMVRRLTDEEMQRFQSGGARTFGEVVSLEGNQFKVRSPWQGERTVLINDQTSFVKDGKPATLQDLKPGERVFVLGKDEGGKFTATRVMIGPLRGQGEFHGGPQPK
jgi:hypothetical protein